MTGDLVTTRLGWKYVMPFSVGGNLGESTLCFFYATLVRASASFQLRIAIRAQEPKIIRVVVAVVSVNVVQNRFYFLAVPDERIGVEKTIWIVAPLR